MGWEDDRAVSEVLGAILLFGILVLAIGSYQSFVVPQQNADVEHEHDKLVNDEFPDIQEAISNAAASGKQRTASITLGVSYPVRVFAIGNSPSTGNIRTGDRHEISVENHDLDETCGLTPETRSIQYRANYLEYDNAGTFVYENGVTYRKIDGSAIVRTEQEIIDGNTIRLHPLTIGDFDRTSSSKEQLQFRPGRTGVSRVTFNETSNLTLQTELEEDTWEDILEGEASADDVSVDGTGQLTITLEPGTYWFRCTPVGIEDEPESQGPVDSDDVEGEDEPFTINPRDAVLLKSSSIDVDTATITLENAGEVEWTMTEARIPFVLANGNPDSADLDGDPNQRLDIGDSYKPIDNVTIESAGQAATHEFTLEFNDSLIRPGESKGGPQFDPLIILSVRFESGDNVKFQTYFITENVESESNGS